MAYYMVFASGKRPVGFQGGTYLDWHEKPLGVFVASNPEEACKSAAADYGQFGTFFAIEGYPWGLELLSSDARKLGSDSMS